MSDSFDLQRFVDAQASIYRQVVEELSRGRKQTHWMWFIFPQIKGLGHTSLANRFAISSLKEADAYLKHSVLGPRLRECTHLVTEIAGRSIDQIFGSPDNLKFRSCMTLFAHATPDNEIFKDALQKYFRGEFDPLTLERL